MIRRLEWKAGRNVTSNPAIKFADFVSANVTTMTMATMTIQELCQSVKMVKKVLAVKEETEEELPFPTFGDAVSSFQVVRRNWCSSFIMPNQQSHNKKIIN
jgi:hypothetical protein